VEILTVGKKGKEYFNLRKKTGGVIKSFEGFGDFISREETKILADFLLDGFLKEKWQEAFAIYTNFRTTLKQEVKISCILPLSASGARETILNIMPEHGRFFKQGGKDVKTERFRYEYKFEPGADEVLEKLLPLIFRIQTHHIILEANASEHSARMVAMKNASENAKDILSELSIEYNKTRQAGITRELVEITAGVQALENE